MKLTKCLTSLAITALLATTAAMAEETVKTKIGELNFTHTFETGYPTDKTVELLYQEMDFQRATQAYIWSTPFVSMLQWQYSFSNELGLENGQIILQETYRDKLGGLTYNTTTPYALTFIDIAEDPWVMEIPEGGVRGSISNMWQIGLSSIIKPGKYLIAGPESTIPANAEKMGYTIVKSDTNTVLAGVRLMSTDANVRKQVLNNINIYPYSEHKNPNPRGYIESSGKKWMAAAPRGIEYFKRLAQGINSNGPVHERDRLIMAGLRELGIEKGKPFKPTAEQVKILEQAVVVGESMVKAIDFAGTERIEGAHYADNSMWEIATTSPTDQRHENYDALDGRAAWFYEAVSNDIAMHGMKNGGWGQVYLTTYKDAQGNWLDGAQNYKLHLPSKPPAKTFWSITLYEVDTRTIINNRTEKADLSSRQDLQVNSDGSIDLYFGPTAPKGMESNWVQTEVGRAWFPYFRFYSPEKALVDGDWVLPNIDKN